MSWIPSLGEFVYLQLGKLDLREVPRHTLGKINIHEKQKEEQKNPSACNGFREDPASGFSQDMKVPIILIIQA